MKDRRSPLLLAVTIVVATGVAMIVGQYVGGKPQALPDGAAPDFRLASLDGPEVGPADFPGQVVVVDFWATWCVPCRYQSEVIAGVYDDLQAAGVEVLGVNLGETEATVRAHLDDEPHPWPTLLDEADRLTGELEIRALPSLMVIDRQGHVVYFEAGILDTDDLLRTVRDAGSA